MEAMSRSDWCLLWEPAPASPHASFYVHSFVLKNNFEPLSGLPLSTHQSPCAVTMVTSFLDRVRKQTIFTRVHPLPSAGPLAGKGNGLEIATARAPPTANIIACRNNIDVFVARDNIIRCGSFTSSACNYRILAHRHASFDIEHLVLNKQGSLLAAVGRHDVVICSLPSSLKCGEGEATIPTRSHRLQIEGSVVQVLWQPSMANDSCIVVLTTTKLVCFDITISTVQPQTVVNLQQLDAPVALISFGNAETLSGALSLYCVTEKGAVYAVFPFVHPAASLVTTQALLNQLAAEVASDSEFVANLQAQLQAPIKPRKVAGQYVLQAGVPHVGSLQGPLVELEGEGQYHIRSIRGAEGLTVLATAVLTASAVFVETLCQLEPLSLQWGAAARRLLHVTHGYKRPTRGFGFVDDSDDEPQDTVVARLSKITCDQIQLPHQRCVYVAELTADKFAIKCDCGFLLADTTNWHIPTRTAAPEVAYELYRVSDVVGFTAACDTITEEGTFLLSLDSNDQLHTRAVARGAELPTYEHLTPTSLEEPIATPTLSTPFEELQIELQSISDKVRQNPIKSSVPAGTINPSDATHLQTLSSVSIQVMGHVSEFTQFAIDLKLRLTTQLNSLRDNIATLNKVKLTLERPLDLEETDQKIVELTARQDSISKRLDTLCNRGFDTVQKLQTHQDLPLSKAEHEWFKELNSTAALVTGGLKSTNQELEHQVRKLVDEAEVENVAANLDSLRINQRVEKAKRWLEREAYMMALARAKLQSISGKLPMRADVK